MSFEPSPTQALLLFGLLARHGACAQAEVMPAPTKADREALVTAKLIGMVKDGRSFQLDLTDAGWAWAGGHLATALPPAHGTLHDLLGRVGDHLARSGETLADFIGSKPEDPAAAAKRKAAEEKQRVEEEKKERLAREKEEKAQAKAFKARTEAEKKERLAREKQQKAEAKAAAAKRKPTRRSAAKPKALTPTALRKRIGDAYLALTGGKKNESVKLSRLRAELADLDRATVDAALGRILQGDKKASLMRHDDPRQIDKADEAAAFSPAGEPFHVLWIAS